MTIAQTVFGVRLTIVIRRLPAGAVVGCRAGASEAVAGFRVLRFGALALALGEGELATLRPDDGDGERDGEGEVLREADGRVAVSASWWAVACVPAAPDGVHAP